MVPELRGGSLVASLQQSTRRPSIFPTQMFQNLDVPAGYGTVLISAAWVSPLQTPALL